MNLALGSHIFNHQFAMPRLVAIATSQEEFEGMKTGSIRVGTELAKPAEAPRLIAPNECWEDKAGLLCIVALGFLTPQLHKGTTTVLQTEDLGIKSALDKAAVCLDHFSEVRASKAHAKRGHLKSGSADRNRPPFKFIPTPDLEQPSLSQLKKRAL